MKRINTLKLFIIILFFTIVIKAQDSNIGLEAGINITQTTSKITYFDFESELKTVFGSYSNTGFYIGGYYALDDKFKFIKKTKFINEIRIKSRLAFASSFLSTLSFLSIEILPSYSLSNKFNVYLGPYVELIDYKNITLGIKLQLQYLLDESFFINGGYYLSFIPITPQQTTTEINYEYAYSHIILGVAYRIKKKPQQQEDNQSE